MGKKIRKAWEAVPSFFQNRVKNRSVLYHCFFIAYDLTLIYLVISFWCEFFQSRSFLSAFSAFTPPNGMEFRMWLDHWFNGQTVSEIVKIIGIASILITWIYGRMNDQNLGIPNRDLLQKRYPDYNWLVLIHILMVILCFWSSRNNQRELSLFSFLIILEGMVMHWHVLNTLILNKARGETYALNYYETQVNSILCETETDSQTKRLRLVNATKLANRMIQQISLDNSSPDKLADLCAKLLLFIADQGEDEQEVILTLSGIWAFSRRDREIKEWLPELRLILQAMTKNDNEQQSDRTITIIYAGLFICLRNRRIQDSVTDELGVADIYNLLLSDVYECEDVMRGTLNDYPRGGGENHKLLTACAICIAHHWLAGTEPIVDIQTLFEEIKHRQPQSLFEGELRNEDIYCSMFSIAFQTKNNDKDFIVAKNALLNDSFGVTARGQGEQAQ